MNVDASKRHHSCMMAMGYIMRYKKARVIMATKKSIGDYLIIVAECEAMRQAIILTIKMNIPRICIRSKMYMI